MRCYSKGDTEYFKLTPQTTLQDCVDFKKVFNERVPNIDFVVVVEDIFYFTIDGTDVLTMENVVVIDRRLDEGYGTFSESEFEELYTTRSPIVKELVKPTPTKKPKKTTPVKTKRSK